MKTLHYSIIVMVSIVIIVMIALFLTSSGMRVHPVEHIGSVTVELNGMYKTGEPIDFVITIKGYGSSCISPDVLITDSNGKIIWQGHHHNYVDLCDPQIGEFERKYVPMGLGGPIIINQTGSYKLSVSIENKTAEAKFTIMQSTRIAGLENDTGVATLGNQTYYFTTVNDTMTTYQGEGVQESFHDVTFTFFPRPFSGGPVGSCGNTNFGSYVKFADEVHESLGVGIPGMPCRENYAQTDLTNHTNPQAGLAVYDGKIKLLVSIDNQTLNTETPEMAGIAFTSVTPCGYVAHGGRSAIVIDLFINQLNLTRGTTTTVDLHVRHLAGIDPFPFAYVTLSPPFGTIFYPAHLASSTTPEQRLNAEETRNLISGSLDLGTLVSFQETMPIKIAAGGEDIVKMYVSVPATLGDEFVDQGGSLNIPIKATSGDANSTIFAQEGGVNFLIVK